MRLIFLTDSTLKVKRRSGVQRVVVEAGRAAAATGAVDFVKWDEVDGQLRYLDARDLHVLFDCDRLPPGVAPHPAAHRVHYRFGDTIADPAQTWLITPEVGYHRKRGNAILARVISQCREYGVRTAGIFYDLIPVTNAVYADLAPPHLEYLAELSRSDVIAPISHHAGAALKAFYAGALGENAASTNRKIHSLPLPELNSETPQQRSAGEGDVVILVGTIEPRKRQVEALTALTDLARTDPAVAALEVHVYGSLHPGSAAAFHKVLSANKRIRYFEHGQAAAIEKSYARARFSIFASNDEGYGLPIAESLVRGVPCLCANFGVMAEVAEGGGCLTVDVNDAAAFADGVRRLVQDEALRAKLRAEIAQRRFRDWTDYALALRAALADADAARDAAVNGLLASMTQNNFPGGARELVLPGVGGERDLRVFCADGPVGALPAAAQDSAFAADIWCLSDPAASQALTEAAERAGAPGLLASRVVIGDPAAGKVELAAQAAKRARWRAIAEDERTYRTLLRAWRSRIPAAATVLTVVISTYNRGPFVEENVRWVLAAIARKALPVNLVVVDNLSTDDTRQRLKKFDGRPRFRLHINSANVGMLGNLRVCSTLQESRHVWVTGDDDFITPTQLHDVAELLAADPGVPFVMHNFAVYHRLQLANGESGEILAAEATPLARAPAASGDATAAVAGAQHDNLFTAIYPIVWRADIFAACFNYPFEGRPFESLIESIPTTKIFLESYPYVEGVWSAPIGISGNAHNSWSRHRPRWHGVLMAEALMLARDAGLDPALLQKWARVQGDLYDEAIGIAQQQNTPIEIEPQERALGERLYRRRLQRGVELAPLSGTAAKGA